MQSYAEFSQAEVQRYGRHLSLSDVGLDGQLRLKKARVLVVGAGGLGGPISLYLAASGVGKLGIVDFDRVEESNLQRQIQFDSNDLGEFKAVAITERLRRQNPHITVVPYVFSLSKDNANPLFDEFDLIVDGTDNFSTRYLVNDLCVARRKPFVYGSVFRFEGQAAVFAAPHGPCYRCLYPDEPSEGLFANCVDGGVLGVLPGMIGMIQATEAIKIILGKTDTLSGRLLLFDALKMSFREVKIKRDPYCFTCRATSSSSEVISSIESPTNPYSSDSLSLSASQLEALMRDEELPLFIDVRELHERQLSCVKDSLHFPLQSLSNSLESLQNLGALKERLIVVYCAAGVRSKIAATFLSEAGYKRVFSLEGGIRSVPSDRMLNK